MFHQLIGVQLIVVLCVNMCFVLSNVVRGRIQAFDWSVDIGSPFNWLSGSVMAI